MTIAGTGNGAAGYQVMDGMVTANSDSLQNNTGAAGTVTNPGVGYLANPNVSYSGGTYNTGAGDTINTAATAQVNIYVRQITILNGGSGYTIVPVVTIAAPRPSGIPTPPTPAGAGFTAFATCTISGGSRQHRHRHLWRPGLRLVLSAHRHLLPFSRHHRQRLRRSRQRRLRHHGVEGLYQSPTVTFTGGGSGSGFINAVGTVTGAITAIKFSNSGLNYDPVLGPPIVTIAPPSRLTSLQSPSLLPGNR